MGIKIKSMNHTKIIANKSRTYALSVLLPLSGYAHLLYHDIQLCTMMTEDKHLAKRMLPLLTKKPLCADVYNQVIE